ncbi:hypothetical protein BST16_12400 [Mycobacterium asiaticum DSM 44297]|nr:hypothetical protein BST16_12400 [Mycobacterium asiaticum DSM 44297]
MVTSVLSCAVCAGQFNGRTDAIYCSSACRQKAYRLRNPRGRMRRAEVKALVLRASVAQRRARELCQEAAESRHKLNAAVLQLARTRRELATNTQLEVTQ